MSAWFAAQCVLNLARNRQKKIKTGALAVTCHAKPCTLNPELVNPIFQKPLYLFETPARRTRMSEWIAAG
jgi:hypothetical protein